MYLIARLHETRSELKRFENSNRFEFSFRLHGNFKNCQFQKLFSLHGDFTAATFQTIVRF